ncbi:MAG: hypothetical protein IJF74_01380 [Clostridia bacterium]|nr:hypothetical protein [Clostridia bacterium]
MKGCLKNVILVKGKESELFEEAYFVMKETEKPHRNADIVAEARRIIETEDMSASPISVKLNRKKKLVCFFIGIGVASLMWSATMLIYLLS